MPFLAFSIVKCAFFTLWLLCACFVTIALFHAHCTRNHNDP